VFERVPESTEHRRFGTGIFANASPSNVRKRTESVGTDFVYSKGSNKRRGTGANIRK
jgi:hypothetical protein